jgi:hypothetical protein
VGNDASFPRDLSRIISPSLDTQATKRLAALLAVEKQYCLHSLTHSLSLSLSHTYTHTHTHLHAQARARDASKGKVWHEVLRKPSVAADALYKLYTTQRNNFLEKKMYKNFLFCNRERVLFLPLQWYGRAVLVIQGNSPVMSVEVIELQASELYSSLSLIQGNDNTNSQG